MAFKRVSSPVRGSLEIRGVLQRVAPMPKNQLGDENGSPQ